MRRKLMDNSMPILFISRYFQNHLTYFSQFLAIFWDFQFIICIKHLFSFPYVSSANKVWRGLFINDIPNFPLTFLSLPCPSLLNHHFYTIIRGTALIYQDCSSPYILPGISWKPWFVINSAMFSIIFCGSRKNVPWFFP